MIKLTIPGIPVAKARPRVGRNGHAFTPQKTVNYESLVQHSYMDQAEGQKLEGPLLIKIDFYFPIPKSYTKKRKEKIGLLKELHTKKPDIDNCIKSITDALNKFAYNDDSQIVRITAAKNYTQKEPRAEIEIVEVKFDAEGMDS
jgi:Holliday junction resolvase RusA-like endonuclease